LVDKYISKNEDAQLPELKTVENPKGALVMGTNCEFEPFEYLDENGDPTGFDVGFAQYLCAEMGYTLTIENMDFDALIPAPRPGSGRRR
ncbi:transporter substrate-binding domain-containing protein, partial [Flavonifractor plautii]|uniref:transporter substrate-binding domain-containing protein n=1 Tax=Flavonifractor plautii TaxID=292800 RepID=UPI0021094C8A